MQDLTSADLERIITVLDRHDVDYIVVGGVAARSHGAQRLTEDVDLVARRDRANLRRLGAALRELGATIRGAPALPQAVIDQQTHPDALAQRQFGNWTTEAGEVDTALFIGTSEQPLDYDRLAVGATTTSLGEIEFKVAGLTDLILAKELADRKKDHDALPELRSLADGDIEPHA